MLSDPDIRRDLLIYARGPFDKAVLVRDTEALRRFQGDVLVLWSPDNKVMPPAHGHRLAALLPRARYAEIPGAYVLSTLDDPEAVAREMSRFLTSTPPQSDRAESFPTVLAEADRVPGGPAADRDLPTRAGSDLGQGRRWAVP